MRRKRKIWYAISDVTLNGVQLWWCPKANKWVRIDSDEAATYHVRQSRRYMNIESANRAAIGLEDRGCDLFVTQHLLKRGKRWVREFLFGNPTLDRGVDLHDSIPPRKGKGWN